jgi:hypothetical protein
MQKRKFWNNLKWILQFSSWNLLAQGQQRFGNPLSSDQNSLAMGNGNPRTLHLLSLNCPFQNIWLRLEGLSLVKCSFVIQYLLTLSYLYSYSNIIIFCYSLIQIIYFFRTKPQCLNLTFNGFFYNSGMYGIGTPTLHLLCIECIHIHIYNKRMLSENIKKNCRSFKNRLKNKPWVSFSDLFCRSANTF